MIDDKSSNTKANIIEVYEENFIKEIKNLGHYLEDYPYIGMDTEFPGIVYPCQNHGKGFYYSFIKGNVDKLKLIQLGITLCNSKGENPSEARTWQFNLRFNCEKDIHSVESVSMLSNSGIDFDFLKTNGIDYRTFAEYFFSSGLILNDNVKWISFNGLSDFAYLLRLVLNTNLPEEEDDFLKDLELYFPNFYDIKILVNSKEKLKGSLNKLAQHLNVDRIGDSHQAGSDSILTSDVFFSLLQSEHLTAEEIKQKKNIIFGVGLGADDNETILYTQFALNNSFNKLSFNSYVYSNNGFSQAKNQFNPYLPYYHSSIDQNQRATNPFNLLMAYSN